MNQLWSRFVAFLDATVADRVGPEQAAAVAVAVAVLLVGWIGARVGSRTFARLAADRLTPQGVMIGRMAIYYLILGVTVVTALDQLGVDLSVLVGAAGLLTVALGFAAQTSASNLISGMFLLGEQPFVVGDIVRVGQTTGEVVSIDLMSVKLRTFDNLLVRVPNESLLKSEITNVTHFPLRRVDLGLCVTHEVDLDEVRRVLLAEATAHPDCLDEPKPMVLFVAFEDHGIRLQFSVWATTEGFLALKNDMADRVRRTLHDHRIRFAPPRRLVELGDPRMEDRAG